MSPDPTPNKPGEPPDRENKPSQTGKPLTPKELENMKMSLIRDDPSWGPTFIHLEGVARERVLRRAAEITLRELNTYGPSEGPSEQDIVGLIGRFEAFKTTSSTDLKTPMLSELERAALDRAFRFINSRKKR